MIPDKSIEDLRTPLYPGLHRLLLPATILLVLLGSVVSYSDWSLLRNSRIEVERINRLMQSNERFLAALTDAESAQRGYLLTGNRVYLGPYEASVKRLPELLEALTRETSRPDQLASIRRLQTLTKEKLSEMATSILVGDVAGPLAAIAVVKQDKGRQSMDAIRELTSTMRHAAAERLLLDAQEVETHSQRSRAVIVVSGCVLAALLLAATRVIRLVEKRREDLITKLDDKKNEMHTTLDSIGDGLIAADLNGVVTFLNPIGAQMTGWSRADAIGKPVDEIFCVIDEQSRARLENPALRVLRERQGNGLASYSLLVRRDRREVPIDDSAAPIFDSRNQLIGTVVVFRDMTARRVAGRALRRWEHVFDTAGFGMAVLSKEADPVFEQVNPALAAMYGYTREELVGKPLSVVDDHDSQAMARDDREDGDHFVREAIHRRGDGTTFSVLSDMTIVRDGTGRISYRIAYFSDITENKRVRAELLQSEGRFRNMADSLPQLVWTSTKDGATEYLNDRWARETGISLDETEGQGWTFFLHPDDRESCGEKWTRAIRTGEVFEAECRLRGRSENSSRWYLCRSIPVRDEHGNIVRWFGSCTDIDEQKRASNALQGGREELQRANDALKRSNADLERFAYAASHDLQEPLRMVVIYSQLLRADYEPKLDSQGLIYLRFAVDGALRMEALVRDLLTYARSSAPVEMPVNGVSAEETLRTVFANLAGAIQESDAHIVVGPLPVVHIPQVHLVQILQNLISNSLKYRAPGIKAEIGVNAERYDGGWVFSVKDNGIGMAPQYQNQVFGVFRRLHGQDRPGTGIGLAVCKSLVERHGGKVWLESALGQGSTFFFTAPG